MSPSFSLTCSAICHSPHIARITHCISSPATPNTPTSIRLAKNWNDFQGANNWDGLLDPLNPILRSEILRYGNFVQAAYTSCDLNSSFSSSSLISSGYRVTRNLYATSTSRLPNWAATAIPSSLSRQTTHIGFVAVCHDRAELSRLGRRDVVISLRGTVTYLEWLDNLRAALTPSRCCSKREPVSHEPMVECGFWSLFTSPGPDHQSLRDQIRDEVHCLLHHFGSGTDVSITFTGHSLGAALAVLAADDVKEMVGRGGPMVTVVSFGGPRVGNGSFRRRMEEQGSRVLRIVNVYDIITKVPGFVDRPEREGVGTNWLLSKTGWLYADIGRELRVSGRRTANVVASHDLKHYLQLVNQLDEVCPAISEEERGQRRWRGPALVACNVS